MSNMINRVFIEDNGRIISTISGIPEILELNKIGDKYIDVDDLPNLDQYWGGSEWVDMPPQPSPHHVFDYDSKEWSDPRTLGQIKIQKWSEIKQQRDTAEYGGFSFLGREFDSDQVSQGRIITAAQLGVDTDWTLKNNEVVQLSAERLIQLRMALAQHVAAVHEKGRVLRLRINEAKTIDDVQSINY